MLCCRSVIIEGECTQQIVEMAAQLGELASTGAGSAAATAAATGRCRYSEAERSKPADN